jgi:ABC-type xylose transport system permease subunit
MTQTIRFWINFVLIGIGLFLLSVVLTFSNFFIFKSQPLTVPTFIVTLMGLFMMYFGLWQGDKVAPVLAPVSRVK